MGLLRWYTRQRESSLSEKIVKYRAHSPIQLFSRVTIKAVKSRNDNRPKLICPLETVLFAGFTLGAD